MEPDLPFVGMAKEVQRLSLAFATGDPLLLLGPQGSGKTRLIQEALSSNQHVLYVAGDPARRLCE
jgi:MoxR-like ATPase